ncbi:MAG: 1-acyl-sn-glycerol-3-phosphate acyltransferase [Lachnospiraceae bacterium]|nr:1-acyl-sn-glycerol-3-phosphate acyltransferase [Lachnospiraceae bacterium]
MRSILVAGFLTLFLIVTFPLIYIFRFVGLFSKKAEVVCSQKVVNVAFRIILFLAGAKRTVIGQENIPKDTPVLFAGNHKSYADIPLAYLTCNKYVGFIAKKEIKKVPSLSWWMTNVNCLFIDRSDVRQSLVMIRKAIEKIKNGYSIFIMPEGTRNHTDKLIPFKEGSFKIAQKTGCPIVPVAITNSDGIYELNHKIKKAKVVIHYGKPIYPSQTEGEKKQIAPYVQSKVEEMLAEDRKLVFGEKSD